VGRALATDSVQPAELSLENLGKHLAQDYGQGEVALVSDRFPQLTMNEAYQVQRWLVLELMKNDRVAGFKGGLTSVPAMRRFVINEPVVGVLLRSGQHQSAPSQLLKIHRSGYRHPMIETELGFVFARAVNTKVKDIDSLKLLVAGVVPVFELPDLGFRQGTRVQAVDLVVNNVVARQHVQGKMRAVDFNVNGLEVQLLCDGKLEHNASAEEAMGDQWQALLWLTNKIIDIGWEIQPGQVVITGALGGMKAAKSCEYKAEFGVLGDMRLQFVD